MNSPKITKWVVVGGIAAYLAVLVATVALVHGASNAPPFAIPFVIATDDLSLSKMFLGRGGVAMCISSGGCHPLDQCLNREVVYSCDVVPSQNHLLHLKIAVIRECPHETFWQLFGIGHLSSPPFEELYKTRLRRRLPEAAAAFWDRRTWYFEPLYGGLYNVGSLPVFVAKRAARRLWPQGHAQFTGARCQSAEAQLKLIDDGGVRRVLRFVGLCHKLIRRIPEAGVVDHQWGANDPARVLQRGVLRRASVARSFCGDYVTRMYVTGRMHADSCPEYMKPHNYARLRENVHRIRVLPGDMIRALKIVRDVERRKIDVFFPLDHMDCLSPRRIEEEAGLMRLLVDERNAGRPVAIVKSVSAPGTGVAYEVLSRHFDVVDVSDRLRFDGSDVYMVQAAYILVARRSGA